METNNMQPQEGLEIIKAMIMQAKQKLADDGFLLIFWGWLVFISAMFNYISIKLDFYEAYWVWVILMPAGGIFSGIYSYLQGKKTKVKTYLDNYLSFLWGGFGIALFLTLIFMGKNGVGQTYFFLMILYGIATFVSGGMLNFKPLVFGGLLSFICAIASLFVQDENLFLIISASLLVSYIIPGHLLRRAYKSQQHV